MLLNYLYPEMESKWIAQCKGTFYRNYNQDVLEIEEDKVLLSRDGFLRLLPEGLLTKDDDLKGENVLEHYKELEWRRELLSEAFAPFDTFVFRKNLLIERQASEMLESKLDFLLREYFDIQLDQLESPLVKEAAVMLPFVSRWRGDFGFISNVLGALMNCHVEMVIGRYSEEDTSVNWLPRVRYILLIPGLSNDEYRQKSMELQPLREFIQEWFIPFEVICEISIKEHHYQPKEKASLTLDYNTELD